MQVHVFLQEIQEDVVVLVIVFCIPKCILIVKYNTTNNKFISSRTSLSTNEEVTDLRIDSMHSKNVICTEKSTVAWLSCVMMFPRGSAYFSLVPLWPLFFRLKLFLRYDKIIYYLSLIALENYSSMLMALENIRDFLMLSFLCNSSVCAELHFLTFNFISSL